MVNPFLRPPDVLEAFGLGAILGEALLTGTAHAVDTGQLGAKSEAVAAE